MQKLQLTQYSRLGLSVTLGLLLSLIILATTRAQDQGDLDTTFNSTGIITTSIGIGSDWAQDVAIQSDGKIVVVGKSDYDNTYYKSHFAVVRYTIAGSLDTSFNSTGVVAGHSGDVDQNFAVARYTSNGALDTTFNGTGIVTTSIDNATNNMGASVVLQPDGKIVVAGVSNYDSNNSKSDIAVVRYAINGVLDSTFNNTGVVTTSLNDGFDVAYDVALQPDGKIVAAGFSDYDFALIRYTVTGTLDSTFNTTGVVTTSIDVAQEATGIAVQPDGKIVAAGYSMNSSGYFYVAVTRYRNNGQLDTAFHQTGIVTTPVGLTSGAEAMALQPDGKIVVAGSSGVGENSDFLVVRYWGDRYAYLPLILKN